MMKRYYMERPGDKYGNVGYVVNNCIPVFAAVVEPDHTGYNRLRIVAPDEMIAKWPTIAIRATVEVEGPARLLSYDEAIQVWRSVGIDI